MHQDERKRNITKVRYLTDVKDSVTEAGGGKEAIVSQVLLPLADSQVQDQGPSRLKLVRFSTNHLISISHWGREPIHGQVLRKKIPRLLIWIIQKILVLLGWKMPPANCCDFVQEWIRRDMENMLEVILWTFGCLYNNRRHAWIDGQCGIWGKHAKTFKIIVTEHFRAFLQSGLNNGQCKRCRIFIVHTFWLGNWGMLCWKGDIRITAVLDNQNRL